MQRYWLLKTEPDAYSLADLEQEGTTPWDGVRNNAAQKHLRAMQPGDRAFIYHTSKERQVVGVVEVVSEPYPDPTLNEAASGERRGTEPVAVDVRMVRRLSQPVTLAAIKADPFFAEFVLVRQSRLSVMPVAPEQWARIVQMAGETE